MSFSMAGRVSLPSRTENGAKYLRADQITRQEIDSPSVGVFMDRKNIGFVKVMELLMCGRLIDPFPFNFDVHFIFFWLVGMTVL